LISGGLFLDQGIAETSEDTKSRVTWISENGSTCNDEINLIVPGGNYGWGAKSKCPHTNNNGKNIQQPKYIFKQASGVVGCAFDEFNNILVGSFDFGDITSLTLNKKRNGIKKAILGAYVHPIATEGNLLTIQRNPVTGGAYFSSVTGIFALQSKLSVAGLG
jgi:hypothetical protein